MTDEKNRHAEPKPSDPPVQQIYNAPFPVSISFPESVVIKMVDATALNDYEILLLICSGCFSVFVGFLVSYFQTWQFLELVVSVIFGVMSVAFGCWAISKRRKITARSKSFRLKTSSVEEVLNDSGVSSEEKHAPSA